MGEGLGDLGLQVVEMDYVEDQPVAATLFTGATEDGDPVFVNVLGRDSWTTRRWTRRWRAAWYDDEGAQHGADRRQEIEHAGWDDDLLDAMWGQLGSLHGAGFSHGGIDSRHVWIDAEGRPALMGSRTRQSMRARNSSTRTSPGCWRRRP